MMNKLISLSFFMFCTTTASARSGQAFYSSHDSLENISQINRSGVFVNLVLGTWLPQKNLSLLGVHPAIGLIVGARGQRLLYGLTITCSLFDSPNKYLVVKDAVEVSTKYFTQAYIGSHIDWEIFRKKQNDILLLSGVGYDCLDVLREKIDGAYKTTKTLETYSINIGVGYRYRVYANEAFGLNIRYNIVTYPNPGGTNISGNSITATLVWALESHEDMSKILRR